MVAIDEETAKQLLALLEYQYIDYVKFPLIHQLLAEIRIKYGISR